MLLGEGTAHTCWVSTAMLFRGVVRVHPDADRAGAWKALVMPRARTQSTARNIMLLRKVFVLRKVWDVWKGAPETTKCTLRVSCGESTTRTSEYN